MNGDRKTEQGLEACGGYYCDPSIGHVDCGPNPKCACSHSLRNHTEHATSEVGSCCRCPCETFVEFDATRQRRRFDHEIDTSEGYVQDTTDREFWRRTYESMAAPGPDENDWLRCPNCGDNDWETWYMKAPWFKAEETGTQPGTPDGPPVHWAQGEQTCPMCNHKWFVQDSG